jgi:hypothetical protein
MIPFIDAQTETIFYATLKELKEKISSLANKNHLLGQYWNQTDSRAPFEEELTLSQLASLDPGMLLKKKSITQEKILALTHAVRTALDRGRLSLVKNLDTTNLDYSVKELASKIITITKDQKNHSDDELLHILGTFSAASMLSAKHDFIGLLENILTQIGSKDFVKLFDNKFSKKQGAQILSKVDQTLASTLPELHLHWRTALSGAGASLQALLSPYLSSSFNDSKTQLVLPIFKILLQAINASEVKISKSIIMGHYTLTPEVAPKLYKALKPKRDFKSAEDVKEHLASAFPFFDLDQLFVNLK